MRASRVLVGAPILVLALGCRSAAPAATPASTPTSAPAATATRGTATAGAATASRAPGDSARPRRRPDPRVQDSVRRANVGRLLAEIAGREQEPAGHVFRNVQALKHVPAGELLRLMDEQYGRGLGWACSNCHVPGQWASDEKKNKTLARGMQRLTDRINATDLPAMPEIGTNEFDKVSCVTCHRGAVHPANTMAVPAPGTPR